MMAREDVVECCLTSLSVTNGHLKGKGGILNCNWVFTRDDNEHDEKWQSDPEVDNLFFNERGT